jgi:dipeptidyl aminopeptidase/acylaminoacyl peptidase
MKGRRSVAGIGRARRGAWGMTRAALAAWAFLAAGPAFAAAPAPAGAKETAAPRGGSIEAFLSARSIASATMPPDGKRVAFLTNITGFNQVWITSSEGGWPEQLTFLPDRVQFVQWSPAPDASRLPLIYGQDAGGNERTALFLLSPEGGPPEPLTSNPRAIHNFGGWSPDGTRIAYASNERDERFFDIYVLDVAGRRAERVLQHDGENAVAAWSPDGKALVIRRVHGSFNSDLTLLDLATRRETPLTAHEGKAEYAAVAWPPGDIVYVSTDQGRDVLNLAAIDIRHPRVTFLEEGKDDVSSLAFSRDGRRMAIAWNAGGATRLSLRDGGVNGRELPAPRVPAGIIGGFEFTADGRLLLMRVESSSEPGDAWLHDTTTGKTTQLTHSSTGGVPRAAFVEPEMVDYPTFDGRSIPALLYMPKPGAGAAGAAHRHPAVVLVHGGPESQSRPTFQPVIQYFVNRGFAVLAPNIRGSTGYGRKYHMLDDARLRGDAIKDIAAAAAWLKASDRIDGDRLAVMGGSYGGYMTLAAVTFHPDLWAAAVDIVGISSFRSFLKNTGAWRQTHRASEYGDPVKDAEFLDSISPLNFVDRITAPLFVVQGANDPRVPRTEAEQIVESLKRRGRPVEYMVFDDEGHGVVKLANRIKAYGAIADFLDQHLKP